MSIPPRKSIKALPTMQDLIEKQRERYIDDGKAMRQTMIDRMRYGYSYYMVHGHGTQLKEFGNRSIPLTGINMIFYCGDGETTKATKEKHGVNADWPKLFNRLIIGNTMPNEYVTEKIDSGGSCPWYRLTSDNNVPNNGIYYIHRNLNDKQYEKLQTINATGMTILELMNYVTTNATQRRLKLPVDVHWIACRAHE